MKAKFIKHNNPRNALGLGPNRRNFKDELDFTRWAILKFLPYYYGAVKKEEISKKIKEELGNSGSVLPDSLYESIKRIFLESEFGSLGRKCFFFWNKKTDICRAILHRIRNAYMEPHPRESLDF